MNPIAFEDVPENLYELYNIVGAEAFTEIVDVYNGEFLYIPKRATLERKHRYEAIRKEYNGHNISQLADKYGYCKKHIKTILFEGD